jgi:hypothetical protein
MDLDSRPKSAHQSDLNSQIIAVVPTGLVDSVTHCKVHRLDRKGRLWG